jgi:hypothetical protein
MPVKGVDHRSSCNQLAHNYHLEGFIWRVPKCELYGRGHSRLKHSKLSCHSTMVEDRDPHPLQQVIPHLWRTDNCSRCSLLDSSYPLGIGCCVKQAMGTLDRAS